MPGWMPVQEDQDAGKKQKNKCVELWLPGLGEWFLSGVAAMVYMQARALFLISYLSSLFLRRAQALTKWCPTK